MQLNPSEISELLKGRIQNLGVSTELRTQGTVVTVTDGICRVHGLSDVMQGEMLEFPNNTFGLALNLERDSVGAVILGAYEQITEGDTVKATGRILEVPVGPDAGRPVLGVGGRVEQGNDLAGGELHILGILLQHLLEYRLEPFAAPSEVIGKHHHGNRCVRRTLERMAGNVYGHPWFCLPCSRTRGGKQKGCQDCRQCLHQDSFHG